MIEGARGVLAEAGLAFADIGVFVHGTTLATNAIIERKGARTALIATDGFRDVIEIADEGRFDQYDINIVKPRPLVPRELRFTVPERMDVHGAVRRPLDEGGRAAASPGAWPSSTSRPSPWPSSTPMPIPRMRRASARSSPRLCPRVSVTLSSRGLPRGARVRAHLHGHRQRLRAAADGGLSAPAGSGRCAELGLASPIHLMTSGGSLASLETAARFPVRLVESGPAGGAILAGRIALERGERRILSFDMGGTTAKICLIDDGEPLQGARLRGRPPVALQEGQRHCRCAFPSSRWWRSAPAAAPSPASTPCSASWSGPTAPAPSRDPPATAAAAPSRPSRTPIVVIGKIDGARFAGGKIAIDAAKAERALAAGVGAKLAGMGAEQAAVARCRDRGREHGQRRARARGGARRGDLPSARWWPSAAPRRCTRAGWPRSSASDASSCRPMPASARPSASWRRRRPTRSMRSRYMRLDSFDAEGANALVDAMQREARGPRPRRGRRAARAR